MAKASHTAVREEHVCVCAFVLAASSACEDVRGPAAASGLRWREGNVKNPMGNPLSRLVFLSLPVHLATALSMCLSI